MTTDLTQTNHLTSGAAIAMASPASSTPCVSHFMRIPTGRILMLLWVACSFCQFAHRDAFNDLSSSASPDARKQMVPRPRQKHHRHTHLHRDTPSIAQNEFRGHACFVWRTQHHRLSWRYLLPTRRSRDRC